MKYKYSSTKYIYMPLPAISKRLSLLPASPIRKLISLAEEAKKRGIKVYNLNIGVPYVKTPEVMLKVLHDWDQNPIVYAPSQGIPELIEAVRKYYQKLGFGFLSNSDIQITTGSTEAVQFACFAVADPGDEIITFEPFYANYNSYAIINDIKLVPVLTKYENGFHLPAQQDIESKITNKTKAILYCNPNNPTGAVYTKKEVDMLVSIAKKYNLYLIGEELYREYCYDGRKHISLLSYFQDIPNQAILLDSLSKRYSLCGARIGILISQNKALMSGILRFAQTRLSSGLIDQAMAAKLSDVPDSYLSDNFNEYNNRRDILLAGLKTIPGLKFIQPEGAFYSILQLPVQDAEDFCKFLLTDFNLNKETIMIAPAQGFYASPGYGKNEVRIAYVLGTNELKKSIEILHQALLAYKKRG